MLEIVGRFGVRGAVGVLAGLAVAFLFGPWINDQAFVVVVVVTMLLVVVVWEGARALGRGLRRGRSRESANEDSVRPLHDEQEDEENQVAWKNSVAHKVTFGYLEMRYSIPTADLLRDLRIRELPFYNEDPAFLPLDVGVFAGEFTKYLASMDFEREEGKTFDHAYGALFSAGMEGENRCSTLGDAVDSNFRFVDEE